MQQLPEQVNMVDVTTVDAYQGREADVIVFSAVRHNQHGRLGFLADPRRLNVAITRPRRRVVAPVTLAASVVQPDAAFWTAFQSVQPACGAQHWSAALRRSSLLCKGWLTEREMTLHHLLLWHSDPSTAISML